LKNNDGPALPESIAKRVKKGKRRHDRKKFLDQILDTLSIIYNSYLIELPALLGLMKR
jgi:hypothetical protein